MAVIILNLVSGAVALLTVYFASILAGGGQDIGISAGEQTLGMIIVIATFTSLIVSLFASHVTKNQAYALAWAALPVMVAALSFQGTVMYTMHEASRYPSASPKIDYVPDVSQDASLASSYILGLWFDKIGFESVLSISNDGTYEKRHASIDGLGMIRISAAIDEQGIWKLSDPTGAKGSHAILTLSPKGKHAETARAYVLYWLNDTTLSLSFITDPEEPQYSYRKLGDGDATTSPAGI